MKMTLTKLDKTKQEQQKYVADLIGNLAYHACNELEEKAEEHQVKQIKTKYDSRNEKTTFVASATVCWEIFDTMRKHDLIKMLVSRLTDEELEQLNLLRSLNNISITDEA
jgi:hypothetical protein